MHVTYWPENDIAVTDFWPMMAYGSPRPGKPRLSTNCRTDSWRGENFENAGPEYCQWSRPKSRLAKTPLESRRGRHVLGGTMITC